MLPLGSVGGDTVCIFVAQLGCV